MRTVLTAVVCVALTGSLAVAADFPRLNGTSEFSFTISRNTLLASVSVEDQLRYTIAEMVVVDSLPCGVVREPISDPALNKALGPIQVSPKACRRELNGLSFNDVIARAAEINRRDPKSFRVPQPNKALERSRDR